MVGETNGKETVPLKGSGWLNEKPKFDEPWKIVGDPFAGTPVSRIALKLS